MNAVARQAGCLPIFLDRAGLTAGPDEVTGWMLRQGAWHLATVPVPDVIYHRATFADAADRSAVRAALKEMQQMRSVSLLNAVNSFSKQQVAEALRFFPATADLTPETIPLTDLADLSRMLERFGAVYVKANHGTHGDSVLRVEPCADGWQLTGKVRGSPTDEQFADADTVARFFQVIQAEGGWMLQQAIDLPKVQGRIFDLRVTVQKNGTGVWEVAWVFVRHAQPGSVASNLSQGAEAYTPAAFFARFAQELPPLSNLAETVGKAAIRTALALEARFGRLGEIGVDIGLDRKGRPWVFEANTKPIHPRMPGLDPALLLRRPFAYAAYLAGRSWAGRASGLALPV
jgi:hypothetical protein